MVLPFFGVLWLASLVVWIVALVDGIRVPDGSMLRNGNKLIWVLVIALTTVVGANIYLAIGRPKPGDRRARRTPCRLPPPSPVEHPALRGPRRAGC